jgi:lipopolysaccharide transport system permease protein
MRAMPLSVEPRASASGRRPGSTPLAKALQDIAEGAALWPLWGLLGWNDILQRYRRSLLGPLWLTASMAIMVVALGVVYAQIFRIAIDDFMPFLCVGLLVWNFISTILSEAGTLFTGSESYIKQIRLPYSVYVFRFLWSKIIIFGHNFVIYFGILIYFRIWPGAPALLALPAFLALVFNGALVAMYLGIVSARFRDVPQIVLSITQIVLFITPIMWKPELLGKSRVLMLFNPFYHLIEVVRAPLLGELPSLENVVGVAVITAINLVIAGAFFARFRSRIAFWV